MFKKYLLVFFATALISCTFSGNADANDPEKHQEEVYGSWQITAASLTQMERKAEEQIIKSVILKKDSTAVISYVDAAKADLNAKWTWKKEKSVGNENFGFSVATDVYIYINNMPVLGLMLHNANGKLSLKAGDYTFEKK